MLRTAPPTTSTPEQPQVQDWIALDFINWRMALQLSQEEAATILDYTSRTISAWERDDNGRIQRHIMLACRYVSDHPETIPILLMEQVAGGEDTP